MTRSSIKWNTNKLYVTRSGYYAWLHRQDNPGQRAQEEEKLCNAIDAFSSNRKSVFVLFEFIRSYGVKCLVSAASV